MKNTVPSNVIVFSIWYGYLSDMVHHPYFDCFLPSWLMAFFLLTKVFFPLSLGQKIIHSAESMLTLKNAHNFTSLQKWL